MTVLTVALGWVAGVSGVVLTTLGAAVLAGQVCVGWVNDLVDRDLDRASARTDKPIAAGRVGVRDVTIAACSAGVMCVPLSLALGTVPGACHLVAVAAALAYDVALKRTVWSWVPYAVGFGLLPVVVWLVSPAAELPPAWMVAAGAALGVGAHGANVLPDHARDQPQASWGCRSGSGRRRCEPGRRRPSHRTRPTDPGSGRHSADMGVGGVHGSAILTLVAVMPAAGNRAAFPAAIGVGGLAVAVLFVRSALG